MSYLAESILSARFPGGLRLAFASLFFSAIFASARRCGIGYGNTQWRIPSGQSAKQIVVVAGFHLHAHQITWRETGSMLDNHDTIYLGSISR